MNKVVKANELTEKIYLERILCSNEVYDIWKSQKTISDDIEYIRKDAFIEKACDWLKEHTLEYAPELNCGVGKIQPDYYTKHFISDFIKYMNSL